MVLKSNTDRTEFNFKLGNNDIEIRGNYKYLGMVLNEYLDFTETANVLSDSAGRAFSSLIVNFYNKMDLMYSFYTKVYESKIVPIMDYASGVWGRNASLNQIRYTVGLFVSFWVSTNVRQML